MQTSNLKTIDELQSELEQDLQSTVGQLNSLITKEFQRLKQTIMDQKLTEPKKQQSP